MPKFWINSAATAYKTLKPLIFLCNSEVLHEGATTLGEKLGQIPLVVNTTKKLFGFEDPMLSQTICGIDFDNPLGLSAGFDYQAKLTQFLPSLGFGFETVGTITNNAYEGNPKPRLARLVKSKSLLVNKGFKNDGVKQVVKKLKLLNFSMPIGISIGRTNGLKAMTQRQALEDISQAFKIVEKSKVKFSYYELNISCPNLVGNVSFYPPKNLQKLLIAIKKIKLSKPIFVKMPIEKSNQEVLEMLEVISNYPISGVIFGNLQKNRQHPTLNQSEIAKYKAGYFSGLPTQKRSDELIKLTYQKYKNKLVIIGCGGIFNAQDAYRKIKLGASLLQFITGLIFEGPQLAAQINLGLVELLKKDKFKNIKEAVGVNNKG